jgi:hypothetical protein
VTSYIEVARERGERNGLVVEPVPPQQPAPVVTRRPDLARFVPGRDWPPLHPAPGGSNPLASTFPKVSCHPPSRRNQVAQVTRLDSLSLEVRLDLGSLQTWNPAHLVRRQVAFVDEPVKRPRRDAE